MASGVSCFGKFKRAVKISEALTVIILNLGTSAGQPVPRRVPSNKNTPAKRVHRSHLGRNQS